MEHSYNMNRQCFFCSQRLAWKSPVYCVQYFPELCAVLCPKVLKVRVQASAFNETLWPIRSQLLGQSTALIDLLCLLNHHQLHLCHTKMFLSKTCKLQFVVSVVTKYSFQSISSQKVKTLRSPNNKSRLFLPSDSESICPPVLRG